MSFPHGGLDSLRRKELCRIICEVLQNRSTQFNLTAALRYTLTHFECGQFGQFALPLQQELSCTRNSLCALVDRERGPRCKSLVRGSQGFHHLLISMLCEGLKNFPSSWIYAA